MTGRTLLRSVSSCIAVAHGSDSSEYSALLCELDGFVAD